jgi:hypothetical protein
MVCTWKRHTPYQKELAGAHETAAAPRCILKTISKTRERGFEDAINVQYNSTNERETIS